MVYIGYKKVKDPSHLSGLFPPFPYLNFLGFLWFGSFWCLSEIVVFCFYKLIIGFVWGFCDLGHPILNLNSTSFEYELKSG